jgi:hypothetical protein
MGTLAGQDGYTPEDEAAMMPETYVNPVTDRLTRNIVGSLATLPQRAIENSQTALDTGNYNPAPFVGGRDASDGHRRDCRLAGQGR